MERETLIQLSQTVLNNDQVRSILFLIAANVVAGVAASLATRTFRLSALADFAERRLIPYLLGYVTVRLITAVMPEWEVFANVVWALILAALIGHIVGNLQAFGLNPPAALGKPSDEE